MESMINATLYILFIIDESFMVVQTNWKTVTDPPWHTITFSQNKWFFYTNHMNFSLIDYLLLFFCRM